MTGQRPLAAFLSALIGFVPFYSGAGERPQPILVVAGDAVSTSLTSEVTARLSNPRLDLVDARSLRPSSRPRIPAFDSARKLLANARARYEELQFRDALEKLQEAKPDSDLDTLQEIFFTEALIHQVLQNNRAARESLNAYVTLGGKAPDSSVFAPEFIRLYKKSVVGVREASTATLKFSPRLGASVGIEIMVDNTRAASPQIQVPVGIHLVRIRAAGHYPYYELLAVSAEGRTLSPELGLLPAELLARSAASSRTPAEHAELMNVLERSSGTEGVVVVTQNNVALYSKGLRQMSRSITPSDGFTVADARVIRQTILGNEKEEPESMVASAVDMSKQQMTDAMLGPSPTGTRWYKTWWFWSLVGVAAVGAGGGAYFLTSGGGSSTPGTVSVSVQGQ